MTLRNSEITYQCKKPHWIANSQQLPAPDNPSCAQETFRPNTDLGGLSRRKGQIYRAMPKTPGARG